MNLINLTIQTPEQIFFDENIGILTIKIEEGFIGILKNHSPFISNIKPCIFEIKNENDQKLKSGIIGNGMIYVTKDKITIVTTKIVWEQDINKSIFQEKLELVNKQLNNLSEKKENSIFKSNSLLKEKEFYTLALEGKNV